MNICGTCKKEYEEVSHQYVVWGDNVVECDTCWEKFRRLANGLPTIPMSEDEINAIISGLKNVFIAYKPMVDKYCYGSLSEPKEFPSHTAWEKHGEKNIPKFKGINE